MTNNAWNQEILVGVSWDLLWPFLGASIAFIILHAVLTPLFRRRSRTAE